MNISYDWYRTFYHVAASGNVTLAAERLFISQPAVSQSIRQLENALGCPLFVRTSKGVTLTAEGKMLYGHISKGMEQIMLGEKRLAAQLAFESGEIYIGASDMTLEYFLLPYLEEFHRLYPGIKISVTNGPTPETLERLNDRKIDFGVVSEPVTELGGGYEVATVRAIEDVFIAGERQREYDNLTFEKLCEVPLIMLEKGTSTREYVDGFLRGYGVNINPEFELATSRLIVQFVKRNLGVGCVVRDFAEEALADGSVFEVKLDKRIPKRNICVVRRKESVSSASEKLLSLMI